jgi:hypothetical protein
MYLRRLNFFITEIHLFFFLTGKFLPFNTSPIFEIYSGRSNREWRTIPATLGAVLHSQGITYRHLVCVHHEEQAEGDQAEGTTIDGEGRQPTFFEIPGQEFGAQESGNA